MRVDAEALFHQGLRQVGVARVSLPPLGPESVTVKARASAISAGTERLIFDGQQPAGLPLDLSLKILNEAQGYPFRYGYALVGQIVEVGTRTDPELVGRSVFVFHPHQDVLVIERQACFLLPESLPPERALFLANMETAVALVHDVDPVLGECGLVLGQGIVGLLVLALLQRLGLKRLVAVDRCPARQDRARALGAHYAGPRVSLEDLPVRGSESLGFDFAVELTGQPSALNEAIEAVGFDGRIIIGSWYGQRQGAIDLGAHFHRRRQRLISSQVSTVSPRKQSRWDANRRLSLALDWLSLIQPEQFITHRLPLKDCQQAFLALDDPAALQIILEY